MQPIVHPDPIHKELDTLADEIAVKTSFPLHWYIFFGIIEPITVLGGIVYSIFFQENFYSELIPEGYADKIASSTVTGAARKGMRSFWKVATQESTGFNADASTKVIRTISEPARMALAQLGSCYFLIFLNSALMLYFIRTHFSHTSLAQEKVLYAFFFVLGAADWTHVLLTIHYLPSASNGTGTGFVSEFAAKLVALTDYRAWNSLLFGNIIITLVLFSFRAAWWMGIARHSFLTGEEVVSTSVVASKGKKRSTRKKSQ